MTTKIYETWSLSCPHFHRTLNPCILFPLVFCGKQVFSKLAWLENQLKIIFQKIALKTRTLLILILHEELTLNNFFLWVYKRKAVMKLTISPTGPFAETSSQRGGGGAQQQLASTILLDNGRVASGQLLAAGGYT